MLEQYINQISPHKCQSSQPPSFQPTSNIFSQTKHFFSSIHSTTTTTTTHHHLQTPNMAHNTTNRRMLAPSSNPKPTMDSTHKNHHPEPNKHFSSLINTSHRGRTATRDQAHVGGGLDTHLQAKAMSVSAMAAAATDPSSDVKRTQKKATLQSVTSKDKASSRRAASKHKVDTKGGSIINNGQEIVKLHYHPTKEDQERERKEVNEEREDIKRLSSGAIVKIKELKVSDEEEEEEEHDLMKRPSLGIGGRRRSLCGSHVELADFFSSTGARIVSVDMPPFMQIHAVGCARKACDSLEKFTSKALALSLKKEFDGVYGPAWHCIVGNSFGSFVTHSVGGFLYFSLDHKLYVLLFKTSVQKAD